MTDNDNYMERCNMDSNATIESKVKQYADDAIKVLDYLARYRLVYHYGSADGIKTAIKSFWGWECHRQQDNAQMARYMRLMPNILSILCPRLKMGSSRHSITREVCKAIRSKYRVVGKRDTKDASGKEWHRKSYILIQPPHIDEIMDIKTGGRLEDRYTKRQCRLIRKIVYGNRAPSDETKTPASTSATLTTSSSTANDDKVLIERLYKAVKLLKTQRDQMEAKMQEMQTTIDNLTHDNQTLRDEIKAAKSSSYPEEHIETTSHADQERAKRERIAKVYDILHRLANNSIIPSSIVNRYSEHYRLGKRIPYNGWTWESDEQSTRYEAIYSNILYRIDNNLPKGLNLRSLLIKAS